MSLTTSTPPTATAICRALISAKVVMPWRRRDMLPGLRALLPRASFLLCPIPVTCAQCLTLHFLGRSTRSNGGKKAVLWTWMSSLRSDHALLTGKAWSNSRSRICTYSSQLPQRGADTLPGLALSCIMALADTAAQIHSQMPAMLGVILHSSRRDRNL